MEGKAVLFKKFAGINSFDIEVDERDPDKLVEIVAALEPTFGAINLEDIQRPRVLHRREQAARADEDPVFHDDQHGTAIIVAAAIRNNPFLTAAATMIAVPCWSSWKTGIFIRSRSLLSTMSSRGRGCPRD